MFKDRFSSPCHHFSLESLSAVVRGQVLVIVVIHMDMTFTEQANQIPIGIGIGIGTAKL